MVDVVVNFNDWPLFRGGSVNAQSFRLIVFYLSLLSPNVVVRSSPSSNLTNYMLLQMYRDGNRAIALIVFTFNFHVSVLRFLPAHHKRFRHLHLSRLVLIDRSTCCIDTLLSRQITQCIVFTLFLPFQCGSIICISNIFRSCKTHMQMVVSHCSEL